LDKIGVPISIESAEQGTPNVVSDDYWKGGPRDDEANKGSVAFISMMMRQYEIREGMDKGNVWVSDQRLNDRKGSVSWRKDAVPLREECRVDLRMVAQ
jgi:hypothetical protein